MSERRLIELRIEEARDDPVQLAELDDQIRDRPELRALRFRIAGHVVRLRKAEQARAPFAAAVARFGIVQPDDRWLFQYAITDENFGRLHDHVRAAAAEERLSRGWEPAYLVLWAAEWFRREHPGGMRRWADLETALNSSRDQSEWRELTRKGLAFWGREVIHGASMRYFLSTLAREGGFPVAAFSQGNESWASAVLARIVSALLSEDVLSEARALEIAETQRPRIPHTFSDDDFLQLCADLALQIARLRKRADAKAETAGIPVAAWLDVHEKGWRDALPIPRDSRRSAMLDELMAVKAHRLPKGYLEASRYLVRNGASWVEAVQLGLDGELSDAIDRAIPRGAGRLWAHASGELSRYIPGELAFLDPARDEKVWLQSATRGDTLRRAPFTCPIELELRTSERAELKLAIPGGRPVRSQFLVFTIDREKDGEPVELLLRGTGSGRYQHEKVVIALPADWEVRTTGNDEELRKAGLAPGGAILWEVVGGALVTTPSNDRYRVLCGQAADGVDEMEINASQLPDFVGPQDDRTEILIGPLDVRLKEGFRTIRTEKRLFTRSLGSTRWVPFEKSRTCGHFDLAWREGDITRASRRVLLLPAGSSIQRTGTGSQTRYLCDGRGAWRLEVETDAPVRAREDGRILLARQHGGLQRRFPANVRWKEQEDAPAAGICLEFPCGAGISDWEGRISPPGEKLTLGNLHMFEAHADGQMKIFGELVDDDGHVVPGIELHWSFEDRMPLSVIEPEIRAMLAPHGTGAFLKLGMLDGIEAYWTVHQFDPAICMDSRGLYSRAAILEDDAELCLRSMSKYAREISVCRYTLTENGNHQPVRVPDFAHSPFLGYVRAGPKVLTRPVWMENGASAGIPCDELAGVMLDGWGSASLEAFLHGLDEEGAPAASSLDAMVRLITSLDGLPPRVFSVLELLPQYPRALMRTLGAAPPERRLEVLNLDLGLGFCWFLLPRKLWQAAMQEISDSMYQRLVSAGVPDPDRYFGDMMSEFRTMLLQSRPSVHDLVFPHEATDARHSVQSFLNAHVDRIRPTSGSMFRDAGCTDLPAFLVQLPAHCLETLDAPFAAAAAAEGKWTPQERHIVRIKTVNRRYPEFFRAAFAAGLG